VNTRPGLLLDENISYPIARALRRRGWNIVHVKDLGMISADDPEIMETAIQSGRIVVTNNYGDYVALDESLRNQGREHPGIVLLTRRPVKDVLDRLEAFDFSQIASTVRFL